MASVSCSNTKGVEGKSFGRPSWVIQPLLFFGEEDIQFVAIRERDSGKIIRTLNAVA